MEYRDQNGVIIQSAEYHREDYSSMELSNNIDISKELAFKDYRDMMFRIMRLIIPTLGDNELNRAIDYSINKRAYNAQVEIQDSYRGEAFNKKSQIIQTVNYIITRKPILTSFGCMFTQHGETPNPMYKLIQEFADTRDMYKKEMFKYDKGTELYNKYNMLQSLSKIDTNAIYGCMGSSSAVFYNVHVASSITRQGRSSISASIMFFESFLANNIKFGSLDEIMTFIDHVCMERDSRKPEFSDQNILDRPISREECFNKLILSCGYNWIPDMIDMDMVWATIFRLDQEDINRIYYKNNLYAFFDNRTPMDMLINTLASLESPFFDPNKPPETISFQLSLLTDLLKEYVFYNYQIIDKIERVERLIREEVVVVDTDSCMINLDPWYHFVEERIRDINIPLKNYQTDGPSLLNKKDINDASDIQEETYQFYDFYTDKIVEERRSINPTKIISEDGLRYSIINVLAFVISKCLRSYFDKIAYLHNTINPGHTTSLLIMKNEFLFKKILLTWVKKHYATYVEVQEGHLVPKGIDTSMDIKGMEIAKTTIPVSTKKALEKILYEDILNSEDINQLQVLNDIAVLERHISDSIHNGSKEYYKPVKIKSIDSYKNPLSQQAIKGSIVYNFIKSPSEPAINLKAAQSNVYVIKTDINKSILENSDLKHNYPDRYNALISLIVDNGAQIYDSEKTAIKNREITSIAIPDTIDTPEWLMEFIDYDEILKNNISGFPLDSIGFTKLSTNSAISGIVNL